MLLYKKNEKDKKFSLNLKKALASVGLLTTEQADASEHDKSDNLLVLPCESIFETDFEKVIIIAEKITQDAIPHLRNGGEIWLVTCEIPEGLDIQDNVNTHLIFCAFSSKATLTVASTNEGSSVLSLQRAVYTLNEKNVLPSEYIIKCMDLSFDTLLLVGVIICLDRMPTDNTLNLCF